MAVVNVSFFFSSWKSILLYSCFLEESWVFVPLVESGICLLVDVATLSSFFLRAHRVAPREILVVICDPKRDWGVLLGIPGLVAV